MVFTTYLHLCNTNNTEKTEAHMVRLGEAQERMLGILRDAKAGYDKEIREAEMGLRATKEVARYKLSLKVREALNMGVPNRQVALKGLGYADVGSLKQFLNPDNPGVAKSGEAREISVPTIKAKGAYPITLGGYDRERMELSVTDSTETSYTLTFLVDGAGLPAEGFWEDFSESPDAEEIRERVSEKYPGIYDWNE
jgi:hypothetical protein